MSKKTDMVSDLTSRKHTEHVINNDGDDAYFFINEMSSADLSKAIRSGKEYLELAAKVRLHQKNAIKDQVLDWEDPEFKDLDARSLVFMLEEMYLFDNKLLNELDKRLIHISNKSNSQK